MQYIGNLTYNVNYNLTKSFAGVKTNVVAGTREAI